jgi:Domain of unknown function (DUF222)
MGVFWMSQSLDALARIDDYLTALAKADGAHAAPEDKRSLDQRRTDIATKLLLGQSVTAGHTDADDLATVKTEIKLMMTADTLVGIDGQPAILDEYGPISADRARRLALQSASTTLRRIFTDPVDGSVMTYDARR